MFLKGDTLMTDKEVFALNLKHLIHQRSLNYKEFANAINIKYTTVLDWVNGRNFPRIEKLETIAKFFNVEKSSLLDNKLKDIKKFIDLHQILEDTIKSIETPNIVRYKKLTLNESNVEFVTRTLTQIMTFLDEEYQASKKRLEFESMLTLLNTKQEVQNKK
jgi:bifunctional S24 family peptidase/transcriptional regulator